MDQGSDPRKASRSSLPPSPARCPPALFPPHSRYSATTLGTQHGREFTYITTPGFRRAKSATSCSTNSLRKPRRVSTATADPRRPQPGEHPAPFARLTWRRETTPHRG